MDVVFKQRLKFKVMYINKSAIYYKYLNTYFYKWRSNPNPARTEACAFHLYNKQANKELKVQFKDMIVKHNTSPKYLGMTLDRTLTYKKHLKITEMKMRSRINLLQKLTGIRWGSIGQTLRTAALALVYSTAEYYATVWLNSSQTGKIDTLLNSAMRVITGSL